MGIWASIGQISWDGSYSSAMATPLFRPEQLWEVVKKGVHRCTLGGGGTAGSQLKTGG